MRLRQDVTWVRCIIKAGYDVGRTRHSHNIFAAPFSKNRQNCPNFGWIIVWDEKCHRTNYYVTFAPIVWSRLQRLLWGNRRGELREWAEPKHWVAFLGVPGGNTPVIINAICYIESETGCLNNPKVLGMNLNVNSLPVSILENQLINFVYPKLIIQS